MVRNAVSVTAMGRRNIHKKVRGISLLFRVRKIQLQHSQSFSQQPDIAIMAGLAVDCEFKPEMPGKTEASRISPLKFAAIANHGVIQKLDIDIPAGLLPVLDGSLLSGGCIKPVDRKKDNRKKPE